MLCSWESPFADCLSGAPNCDYLSRAICPAGEHPLRILRTWVSPPADGSRSGEWSHTLDAVRNRHQAGCRVAVERAADRHILICDGPVYTTPVVDTRTGDVAPNVVLADPALFVSWQLPRVGTTTRLTCVTSRMVSPSSPPRHRPR